MGSDSSKGAAKNTSLHCISKIKLSLQKSIENIFWDYKSIGYQSVGPVMLLSEKKKEYVNPQLIATFASFEKSFPFYRQVLGDGNCFYRAVFFLYIEQLIDLFEEGSTSSLEQVDRRFLMMMDQSDKLQSTVKSESIPKPLLRFLPQIGSLFYYGIQVLNYDIIQNSRISRGEKIKRFRAMLSKHPVFDFSTILLMRRFALLAVDCFSQQLFAFFIGNEKEIIKNYGIEAQDCIVKLICEFLMIKISVQNVGKHGVNQSEFIPEINQNKDLTVLSSIIHLFFRPGHFDICYDQQQVSQHYQVIPDRKTENTQQNSDKQVEEDYAIQNNQQNIRVQYPQIQAYQPSQHLQLPMENNQQQQIQQQLKQPPNIFHAQNQQLSYNQYQQLVILHLPQECCFFCRQLIPMLINGMRVCQGCYRMKLGQLPIKCKVCASVLDQNSCLCVKCQSSYFEYFSLPEPRVDQHPQLPQQVKLNQLSKLLSDNEKEHSRFIFNNKTQTFEITEDFQRVQPSHVRCTLCLNLTTNQRYLSCRRHVFCLNCSSGLNSMRGICTCCDQY